jgi:hypothetical protein
LLDGDDGLPGHPDPLRQLRLCHLAVSESQRAYRVVILVGLLAATGLQASPVDDEFHDGSGDRPQHERSGLWLLACGRFVRTWACMRCGQVRGD